MKLKLSRLSISQPRNDPGGKAEIGLPFTPDYSFTGGGPVMGHQVGNPCLEKIHLQVTQRNAPQGSACQGQVDTQYSEVYR